MILRCPNCQKENNIQKFCVYCGHELLTDHQFKLLTESTNPYCLNCGRPVKKGQCECECGYKFEDIHCPECNSINEYAYTFCISCGSKLWTHDITFYHYFVQKDFEYKNTPNGLLYHKELHKSKISKTSLKNLKLETLEYDILKLEEHLCEIGSRWKIIAPDYCIMCMNFIDQTEYSCEKLDYAFADKKRVDFIKTAKYIKPRFDDDKLKLTSINSRNYLSSLSPAFGESQMEYRERLRWQFEQNYDFKLNIIEEIDRRKKEEIKLKKQQEKRRQEAEYIRLYGGGYCSSSCRYYDYRREYYDKHGVKNRDSWDSYEDEEYCDLGHSFHSGRFCKDYKK